MKMFLCSSVILCVIIPLFAAGKAVDRCPTIINRAQWGARQAKGSNRLDQNPAPIVIVHHSDTPTCTSRETCKNRIQNIQQYHMVSKGWDDIGYNFLISGDGTVYEGRGWGVTGAHAKGWNNRSVGICLLGNFQDQEPSSSQLRSLETLIACGVEREDISKRYSLLGHRQATRTSCPGNKLFRILQHMHNFEANPV